MKVRLPQNRKNVLQQPLCSGKDEEVTFMLDESAVGLSVEQDFSYFAAASLSSMYPEHYLILFLRITLPLITTLWISLVPSKIWKIFASRISFSTG